MRVGLGLWSQKINITKRVPPVICSAAVVAAPAVPLSGGRSPSRLLQFRSQVVGVTRASRKKQWRRMSYTALLFSKGNIGNRNLNKKI